MKTRKVKDLMVPISAYKKISPQATLFEAALTLKEVQREFDKEPDRDMVVVAGGDDQVVGMVSQLDLLKGLEPRYGEVGIPSGASLAGFNPVFIKSMVESFGLWEKPLTDLCRKAADVQAKDFMHVPQDDQYVEVEAALDQAIHQLIMGQHRTLLVTQGQEVVGVLRLPEVYREVEEAIEACQI
jgi:hypothetical protein